MARKPTQKSTAVAVQKQQSTAVMSLADAMAADAGKGVSKAAEDNLIPLIYVLQSNSPQVNKRSADYIKGAEPGNIWLRNCANPIVDGEEGIVFQPIFFSKDWVEWIVRNEGGGFVGRHSELPQEAVNKPDPQNPKRIRWVLPNGHEVVETRYHLGFVWLKMGKETVRMPYVIPFTSTGHTVSKSWMVLMNQKALGKGTAPSFACLYRLRTRQRTNAAGEWFSFDVSDERWLEDGEAEAYFEAKAMFDAYASGSGRGFDVEADTGGAASDDAAM